MKRRNTMSATLNDFFKAYIQWLEGGAPEEQPFSREYGLCDNLDIFTEGDSGAVGYSLSIELGELFLSEGLSKRFPFDKDEDEFFNQSQLMCMHENPLRVVWVREKAKQGNE